MPKVLLCLFSSLQGKNFATDFQHALKPYQISETRAKDLLVLAPATVNSWSRVLGCACGPHQTPIDLQLQLLPPTLRQRVRF